MADQRNAARNVHCGQRLTIVKCIASDLPHAGRNGDAGDVRAPERLCTDGLDGIGNDGRFACALVGQKLPLPDEKIRGAVVIEPVLVQFVQLPGKGTDAVAGSCAERAAVQKGIFALEHDGRQIRAGGKRALTDFRHARGNLYLLQIVVVEERPLADGFQTFGQDDLAQLGMGLAAPIIVVIERIVRNIGHGIRQNDLCHKFVRRTVALHVMEALDAYNGIAVDGRGHGDRFLITVIRSDFNGVACHKAVGKTVTAVGGGLFRSHCRHRAGKRNEEQNEGKNEKHSKDFSFHHGLFRREIPTILSVEYIYQGKLKKGLFKFSSRAFGNALLSSHHYTARQFSFIMPKRL